MLLAGATALHQIQERPKNCSRPRETPGSHREEEAGRRLAWTSATHDEGTTLDAHQVQPSAREHASGEEKEPQTGS